MSLVCNYHLHAGICKKLLHLLFLLIPEQLWIKVTTVLEHCFEALQKVVNSHLNVDRSLVAETRIEYRMMRVTSYKVGHIRV